MEEDLKKKLDQIHFSIKALGWIVLVLIGLVLGWRWN